MPTPSAGPTRATALSGLLAAAVVVFMTVSVFLPALTAPFAVDDHANILGNTAFRGLGMKELRWMFTSFHYGHYQPLSWLTLALDHRAWGLDPFGFHLTNLALHTVNALLVLILLAQLLAIGYRGAGVRPGWLVFSCAVGALFFAVHPLRAESVVYITERRDLVSGVFLFAAVAWYLRTHADGGPCRRPDQVIISTLVFLSLLGKAWAITLPLVLLVLDAYPLRRMGNTPLWQLLREKVPLFLMAVVFAGMAFFAQQQAGWMPSMETHPWWMRLGQACYGLCFYVWKTLVPLDLYFLHLLPSPGEAVPLMAASAVVLLCTVALLASSARSHPWAAASFLVYAIVVTPVLGITQAGSQFVADRYSYISCVPFAVLAAGAVAAVGRAAAEGRLRPVWQRITVLACVLLVTALSLLSALQTDTWQSEQALWTNVARHEPGNSLARNNLGVVFRLAGRHREAYREFSAAIRANPSYTQAYLNRGLLLLQSGAFAPAKADFTAATKTGPRRADTHFCLGYVLMRSGDLEGALQEYSAAIGMDPAYAEAFNNRGFVRMLRGNGAGALSDFTRAIRINPGYAAAYFNRGELLVRQGRRREALHDFMRALQCAPADWPDRDAAMRYAASLAAEDDAATRR